MAHIRPARASNPRHRTHGHNGEAARGQTIPRGTGRRQKGTMTTTEPHTHKIATTKPRRLVAQRTSTGGGKSVHVRMRFAGERSITHRGRPSTPRHKGGRIPRAHTTTNPTLPHECLAARRQRPKCPGRRVAVASAASQGAPSAICRCHCHNNETHSPDQPETPPTNAKAKRHGWKRLPTKKCGCNAVLSHASVAKPLAPWGCGSTRLVDRRRLQQQLRTKS